MRTHPPYTIDEIMRAAKHGPAVGGFIMNERAARAAATEQAQIHAAGYQRSQAIAVWVTGAFLVLVAIAAWPWPHPLG